MAGFPAQLACEVVWPPQCLRVTSSEVGDRGLGKAPSGPQFRRQETYPPPAFPFPGKEQERRVGGGRERGCGSRPRVQTWGPGWQCTHLTLGEAAALCLQTVSHCLSLPTWTRLCDSVLREVTRGRDPFTERMSCVPPGLSRLPEPEPPGMAVQEPVVASAGPGSWLLARAAWAPCGHPVESPLFQVDQVSLPDGA